MLNPLAWQSFLWWWKTGNKWISELQRSTFYLNLTLQKSLFTTGEETNLFFLSVQTSCPTVCNFCLFMEFSLKKRFHCLNFTGFDICLFLKAWLSLMELLEKFFFNLRSLSTISYWVDLLFRKQQCLKEMICNCSLVKNDKVVQ